MPPAYRGRAGAKNGDPDMGQAKRLTERQNAIVLENLDYAARLARKFYQEHKVPGVDFDDLLGAAHLGLCDAACRFDFEQGVNFRTYSFWRIRGEMYDWLRKQSGYSRKRRKHEPEGKEQAKSNEVAEYRSSFEHNVSELRFLAKSIDALGIELHTDGLDGGIDLTYIDDLCPVKYAERRAKQRYVSELICGLRGREREVIEMKYYLDYSYNEISEVFEGARKSWLSRLHTRALDRLRDSVVDDEAREFLHVA